MVRACRHKIGRVGAEGAIPNPALVACQCCFQRQGFWFVKFRYRVLDFPNLGRVVCAAGRKLLDVWRQKYPGDVFLVCAEMRHWHQSRAIVLGLEAPDEDVALYVSVTCSVFMSSIEPTALLAAQSRVPSLATVTLDTDTSSSGVR